jgi:sulfide:quinone oxidoreductase
MTKILVLGAGFGGLELCTLLSEALGDSIEVRLIDKSDHFAFGFSKLDIMFGHAKPQAVRLPYANFAKLGVQLTKNP